MSIPCEKSKEKTTTVRERVYMYATTHMYFVFSSAQPYKKQQKYVVDKIIFDHTCIEANDNRANSSLVVLNNGREEESDK